MKRGFTLVEVLISGALLFTLIALSVRVFVPALTIWRRNQAKATVQQAALQTAYRIRHDVFHSAPGVMQVKPRLLVVLSAGEPPAFDQDGQPLWSEWVGYWLDDDGRLWRFTRPIPPTPDAPTTVPTGLPSDADLTDHGRIVARDVLSFIPTAGPTGGARYRLKLEFGGFSYELLSGAVSAYQGDT